jgi:hypothetical protein
LPGDGSHDIPPISRALARRQDPRGYVVGDANGQALAHIYSRDSEAEALQAKGPDDGRGASRGAQPSRRRTFVAQFDRINVGLG